MVTMDIMSNICVVTAQMPYTVATLKYKENTINKNSTKMYDFLNIYCM